MSTPGPEGDRLAQEFPVGIDLGTTYSVLAYIDATGRPLTVPNRAGDLLTPSAILIDENDILVGKEAVKNSVLTPDRYAECFKRDMGEASCRRKLCQMEVPPEVLSALVLERLKEDGQQRLGPIREVVVTVPAFFDESRRMVTQDAGRLAGLDVIDIINEPTAAALAYGHLHGFLDLSQPEAQKPLRVVVYDLGGGTFDVTILEIERSQFRALATDGDVQLGGKDFDERLFNYLAETFQAAHGADPRSDALDAAQLWLDAQEAKHTLSERAKTTVPVFHAGVRMRIDVGRTEFEDMTRDLLERTETTSSLLLKQAGLSWPEIDRVLLVGGSTRMPMVAQMLRNLTGKEPDRSLSPDEVVAHGAALYARMLRERESGASPKCELINVNSHSLGVVGMDPKTRLRSNVILIPKNSRLPCRVLKTFRTARENQRSVRVPIVEGESHRPEDCVSLGECIVRGLPAGLPSGARIEVEYSYATNGRISVSARVPASRQSAHVEIQRNHPGNADDLATWHARLCGKAASATTSSGPRDRESALKRLDTLYARLGQAAMNELLPPTLHRHQQTARAAVEELARAKERLREAQCARQTAASTPDVIQSAAGLANAQSLLQQTQTRSDFAFLSFGRECVDAGFCPSGLNADFEEIQHLRQDVEG